MTDPIFTHLRLIVEDGLARLTIVRSDARNALNLQLCGDLRRAFQFLDGASDVRLILLDAEGPVFCAGADLKERKDKDAAWVRMRRLAAFAAYETIELCSKPVIAVVDGPIVGSGGEIAMACDFILASTNTSFRFPEAHWGTVGATQRLQRVVGKRMAKELLYTARLLPADEAHRLGLVNRLVSPEDLPALVATMAAQIGKAPPLAMRLTKQSIDLGGQTDLGNGIRIEIAAIERCLADTEWKAGLESFAQRDNTTERGAQHHGEG